MSIFRPYSEAEFEANIRESLPLFHGMALRILKNAADAGGVVVFCCGHPISWSGGWGESSSMKATISFGGEGAKRLWP